MTRETFGDLLRNEREERELSIRAAAETLEVDPDWLLALERNDFDALPDEATMRACLERYADCLEVEADLMIADYDREREAFLRAQEESVASASEEAHSPEPEEAPIEASEAPESTEAPELREQSMQFEEIVTQPMSSPLSIPSTPPPTTPPPANAGGASRHQPRRSIPTLPLIAVALVAIGIVGLLGWKKPSESDLPSTEETTQTAAAAVIDPAPDRSERPPGVDTEPIKPTEPVRPPAEVERIWASPAGVSPTEAIPPETSTAEATAPETPPLRVTPEAALEGAPEVKAVSLASSELSISEHGVGTDVQDRKLIGRSNRFSAGTRVWYWTRVLGGGNGDKIEHVWLQGGVEQARISLRVGAATWRTFSSTTLVGSLTSDWAVEARDASGAVLSRSEFVSVE